MNRRLVLLALFLALIGLLYSLAANSGFLSPLLSAAPMPPIVEQSIDEILLALEAEAAAHQPGIADAWGPGITTAALEQAEGTLGAPLHPEMKALYSWHNGLTTGAELFPGYGFMPLEEAVRTNREANAAYARAGLGALMGHEANWLALFLDPAGDGYFYDPLMPYERGGVFFHFRETGYYIHFPSVRNLLAAITECFRQGVYRGGETLDFDLELRILTRYGRESQQ